MPDPKLEIILAAKDITGRTFDTLNQRISKMVTNVFSLRGALTAVAGAAGIGYFVKSSIEAADTIAKTADRIGIATGALQEYRHAAELSGVSQTGLDKGIEANKIGGIGRKSCQKQKKFGGSLSTNNED